jgi:hypothetical protein
MQRLSQSIDNLPPHLQRKVFDYIDELTKDNSKKRKKLKLNWAGGLKEFKDQFTSLELQKKSLDWWTN